MTDYYNLQSDEVIKLLRTSPNGLSNEEASKRLQEYGYNELPKEKGVTALGIFFSQFNNVLSWLLIFAGLLSIFLGEHIDSIAMFSIVIINAILGFVQEYKADLALKSLQKISAPVARVMRGAQEMKIDSRMIVPGDIVFLESGDIVPADSRIIEESILKVDESSLTGESIPSLKVTHSFKAGTTVADQENMAFMGTIVTYGRGKSVITATGQTTEFGKIAKSIQMTKESDTPLQIKFSQMTQQIGIIAVVLILAVFFIGTFKTGLSVEQALITSLALAVATIPVALPTIVTIGLSVGSKKLAEQNMIIKKLTATESIGAATIVCTDKTGTITKNEMTVTKIFYNKQIIDVTGTGYEPKGTFYINGKQIDSKGIEPLLKIGFLCNNSKISSDGLKHKIIGDPTEGSLMVLAHKAGFESFNDSKFIMEFPFDSDRKRMSSLLSDKDKRVVKSYVKGACDLLLDNCDRIMEEGRIRKITKEDRVKIISINDNFAASALRVLAFAFKELPKQKKYSIDDAEKDLIFIGLVGMIDPPREEIKDAIKQCHEAGIKVMVITGDHAETTKAIAEQIGVFKKGDIVLTGSQIDQLTDKELEEKLDKIRIIARALPIQKLRIVDLLKRKGHLTLMTGDGVNDAPALKRADVGIAMGITGTDVAKEVSKAILVDDNFATIVNAINKGRNIYDQMIKSAKYLLSCNVGEILTILTVLALNMPLPLIPLQILLINLLTDALPAMGLGMEPPEQGIMKRPPRSMNEKPLSNQTLISILLFGVLMAAGTVFMFIKYADGSLIKAQTVAFTTLVMFQLFAVMSSRTLSFSLRLLNPFSNKVLLVSVIASVTIHLIVIYWGPMQRIFGTVGLQLSDWTLILLVSSLGFVIMEASKLIFNFRGYKNSDTEIS